MSTASCFIEPLDVLFLRGNKLFGDPGSYGESLVPPWPSVAAGAIRSRLLADDRIDLADFAAGKIDHPSLGSPTQPGSFTVTAFQLARRFADRRVEVLIQPPADLVISERDGRTNVHRLQPAALSGSIQSSSTAPLLPVLAEEQRGKPAGGYWLTQTGWQKYLAGANPATTDLLKSSQLWGIDHRVGVGLDTGTRHAADGKLFTVQAVAMKKAEHGEGFDVGFLTTITGAALPKLGLLRFGGDGRAAALHATATPPPLADHAAIAKSRRCRVVLTTPGLFANGWRLTGVDAEGRFNLHGVRGRLVCAAVPRFETVSGWDLARRAPKAAQRVAPTGSVYWLDELETSADALDKLVTTGLWSEDCEDVYRRAEGFNRIAIATY